MTAYGEHNLWATKAAQEIRDIGSTVLRRAWPVEALAKLRAAILTSVEQRNVRVASNADVGDRMYASHGVGTFATLTAENLYMPGDVVELFRDSLYHEVCRAYFKSDNLYVVPNRLGFRDHEPNRSAKSFIPYHQDSYTQDARTPQVLNCWIPLDPDAGKTAPGLEVVRNVCRPDFPRKDFGLRTENAAYDFITIDRDAIIESYGDNFLAPEFELGDALVFSQDVIHRTYVTPEMTRRRINFELRIFSAESVAAGYSIDSLSPFALRVS